MSFFDNDFTGDSNNVKQITDAYHLIPNTVRNNFSRKMQFQENPRLMTYVEGKKHVLSSSRNLYKHFTVKENYFCLENHGSLNTFKLLGRSFCRECLKKAVTTALLEDKELDKSLFLVKFDKNMIKIKSEEIENLFEITLDKLAIEMKLKYCKFCKVSSVKANILAMPECLCDVCTKCLANRISNATDGLLVLNELEKKSLSYSKIITCVCGEAKYHADLVTYVFPNHKELIKTAYQRFMSEIENHCFVCNIYVSGLESKFFINDAVHKMCGDCQIKLEIEFKKNDKKVWLSCYFCAEGKHNLALSMFIKKRKQKEKGSYCKCFIF